MPRCTPTLSKSFAASGSLALSLLITLSPGASAQKGSDAGSRYPAAFTLTDMPAISLTPRPVDPPGTQSIDVTIPKLDQVNTQSGFATTADTTQTTPLQDVLGPDGSDLVTHPGYSGYGYIVNNKTGSDLKSFTLTFSTPASITDINVDTYVRTNDLQNFVYSVGNNPQPVSTWDVQKTSVFSNTGRDWTILFTEANGFRWRDVNDTSGGYPAFTVLSSLFPVGSNIQFGYRPSLTAAVPEPGTWGLFLGSGVVTLGFAARRRRRV